MKNPFSFRIDYAASIKDDERLIDELTDPRVVAAAPLFEAMLPAMAPEFRAKQVNVGTFIFGSLEGAPERAAIFGLTWVEAAAWFLGSDYGHANYTREMELRGEELHAKLGHLRIMSEADRLAALKQAKASLARHRRNATKFPGKVSP
jgi:hypothetical protein